MKKFYELTLDELYAILRLRCQAFIVEQVPYQDLDNLDQKALHLFGQDNSGEVVAYLRIFEKGVAFMDASFGRVCVSSACRRQGIASQMLDIALEHMDKHMDAPVIHISAQKYAVPLYASKGFVPVGEGYLEDGIPHTGMERVKNK